ncbi:deuterosome assembly protein 1 isoform X1 [Pleurodeles waltl]
MTQQMETFGQFFRLRNSSCEAELQELMHQIDIMVHSKKTEWERKMKALEAKLESQDQEMEKARRSAEQKSEEVGVLRKKLESAETSQQMIVQKYEGQLNSLKYQLGKLKNTYEKLQLHTTKHSKFNHAENSADLQKLEEFNVKSKEWEKQKSLYQKHIASLDAQRKSLAEKCELFQKQSQAYQAQLNSRKHFLDEAIISSQSDNRRLRCQLDNSQETIKSDEMIIENLKFAMSEVTSSRNMLQKENQQLLQELTRGQEQCQKLQEELSKAKIALQSREDLLRVVELEHIELENEVAKYRASRTRQESVKSFESSSTSCIRLNDELAKKTQELPKVGLDQENQQKDLNKARIHLYQQDNLAGYQSERTKLEPSDLMEKLRQKDITIATIIKDARLLERQLKAELEMKEKQLSKQQISIMNQEALNKENKHLKELMENLEGTLTTGLKPFQEPRESYAVSMSTLQDKNETLQGDLESLRCKLERSLDAAQKHSGTQWDAHQETIQRHTNEDRLFEHEEEWPMDSLMDLRYHTTKDSALGSEGNVSPSHSGMASPSERLSICGEPIMDDIPSFTADGDQHHQRSLHSEIDMSNILMDSLYSKGDSSPPPSQHMSFSATEHFLREEEKRAKEFEKLLGSHIDELHKNSGRTLAKYTRIGQNRHM